MLTSANKSGFTIIEVLISIAIALLLILGINQVFSIAQQTSGAGTAALVQVEESRGGQTIMQGDFDSIVNGPDSPGIVIVSEPIYAYRNRQELLANRNTGGNAVQYINDPVNQNNNTGIQQSLTTTNARVHRIDRIMFFVRGTQRRQTAAAPGFVSPTGWLESYVWYGHLALPRNYPFDPRHQPYGGPIPNYPNPFSNGDFSNPGDPGVNNQPTTYNPNNYFASDWILGRMPVLLVPFPTFDASGVFEPTVAPGSPQGTALTILTANNISPARAYQQNQLGPTAALAPPTPLYSSRYDMAYTSIDGMRQALSNFPAINGGPPAWWQHLSGVQVQSPGAFPSDIRFEANPFPIRPPLQPPPTTAQLAQWASAASALQAPMFLRGCSQFIVEFAGDFMTQDDNPASATFGAPLQATSDGQIDYVVARLPSGERVKKVRWYGFPRETTGDGHVLHDHNFATHPGGDDVVPFRDMFNGPTWGFERFVNQTIPLRTDYAQTPTTVQVGSQYICAWGTDTPNVPRPKMIRITIALDDPQGRLNGEQYFEYVFNLP